MRTRWYATFSALVGLIGCGAPSGEQLGETSSAVVGIYTVYPTSQWTGNGEYPPLGEWDATPGTDSNCRTTPSRHYGCVDNIGTSGHSNLNKVGLPSNYFPEREYMIFRGMSSQSYWPAVYDIGTISIHVTGWAEGGVGCIDSGYIINNHFFSPGGAYWPYLCWSSTTPTTQRVDFPVNPNTNTIWTRADVANDFSGFFANGDFGASGMPPAPSNDVGIKSVVKSFWFTIEYAM